MQITIKQSYGPHPKKLTQLCDKLDVTPTKLASDLYKLCRWMQDHGHHYSMRPINFTHHNRTRERNGEDPLNIYFLDTDNWGLFLSVADGIMYYSKSAKWEGWGINKNPITKSDQYEVWSWEIQWLEKFAYLTPERAEAIQSRLDAITKANQRKPTRNHNVSALETLDTIEIAHRRELAKLMAVWMFSFRRYKGLGDKTYTWLQNIWEAQVYIMTAELEYRTGADPEPRSSKKKTASAKQDWCSSALWLTGVNKIYSDEFIEMVKAADMPFNPSVNYDDLPKQVPGKAPVMKMSQTDLMHEFMRWVTDNEIDPDSFEGEDAHMLKIKLRNTLQDALEDIRKQFARAKGQHVPVQEIEDTHEET